LQFGGHTQSIDRKWLISLSDSRISGIHEIRDMRGEEWLKALIAVFVDFERLDFRVEC
jgi:hypothetical protein